MGEARVQTTTHTLVHFYNLNKLIDQIKFADELYTSTLQTMENSSISTLRAEKLVGSNAYRMRTVINHCKFINFTRNNLYEKLEVVGMHYNNFTRTKRGIINGLGTVIKGITGNLDAMDGERTDAILDELRLEHKALQGQIKAQASVNNDLIREYNNIIEVIKQTGIEVADNLNQFNNQLNNFQELYHLLDTLNQINILYEMILTTVTEIENSIAFCQTNVLHPSIISSTELYTSLRQIANQYTNQFPVELARVNMLTIIKLVTVSCKFSEENEIVYMIDIPIVEKPKFSLYYLYSIPSIIPAEYSTVIPKVKYILKGQVNKGMQRPCRPITNNLHLCKAEDKDHHNLECEQEILTHETTTKCEYTRLDITENQLQWIPEANQYAAVFLRKESLQILHNDSTIHRTLQGIFLIRPDSSHKVYYKNQELLPWAKTRGHPTVLQDLEIHWEPSRTSPITLKMKTMELAKLATNYATPEGDHTFYTFKINPWILLLAFSLCGYILISRIFRNRETPANQQTTATLQRLPAEVPFRGGGVTCT
ncbi:uncharacterized protein [Rhodnius prolixus]|uniref:uncharacterized protein n=1 Tax=Rhodnius prolixus TaxID=13249 RepID=UPI003D1884F9